MYCVCLQDSKKFLSNLSQAQVFNVDVNNKLCCKHSSTSSLPWYILLYCPSAVRKTLWTNDIMCK